MIFAFVLIGCCDYFGFCFTTLNRKALCFKNPRWRPHTSRRNIEILSIRSQKIRQQCRLKTKIHQFSFFRLSPVVAKSLYPQEEVYLNKRCYPGPLLSRDLVRSLPDAVRGSVVGPEKHNIMRLCMQHLVSASINPKQVLELFSREFYQSKKNRLMINM